MALKFIKNQKILKCNKYDFILLKKIFEDNCHIRAHTMNVINITVVSDFQKVIDFLCCSQVFSTIKLTITIHVLYIVVLNQYQYHHKLSHSYKCHYDR